MFHAILYAAITILALFGLISLIYYIAVRLMHLHSKDAYLVVLPADANSRDVAGQLYTEKLRMSFFGDGETGHVIALDCGMDEIQLQNCKSLCLESTGLYVCKPEQLGELCVSLSQTNEDT